MKRKKRLLQMIAWLMVFAMLGTGMNLPAGAAAKSRPRLNRTKATIRVGKKLKLKVKKIKKKQKVKWSSSRKKVATVSKKGVVKGKKAGKTVIKAKVGKKTLKCRVTVKAKNGSSPSAAVASASPGTGGGSSAAPTAKPAGTPAASRMPSQTPAGSISPVNPSVSPQASSAAGSASPAVSSSAEPAASGTAPSAAPTEPSGVPTSGPTGSVTPEPPHGSAGPAGSSQQPWVTPEVTPTSEPTKTPVVVTETPAPPTYNVTIRTYKDDTLWEDSGKTYYLRKEGEELFEEDMEVEDGTYDIYVSDGEALTDSGEDAVVNGGDQEVRIDYYTVLFTDNNVLMENIPAQIVRKGEPAVCPDITPGKKDYSFTGWYVDDGVSDGYITYDFKQPVTASVMLIAGWTYSPGMTVYTAAYYYEKADGTYSSVADETVTDISAQAEAVVSAPEKAGYEVDPGQTGSYSVSADGNTVASYYYKRKSYTVTWELNGGTLNGSGQTTTTVKYGMEIVPPTGMTRAGYTCSGWKDETNIPLTSEATMRASDMTYTAVWTVEKYSVTYNWNGGACYVYYPTSYTVEDAAVTLPVPERGGYTFTGWTGSNGSTAQTTVTIAQGSTGNKTYTANWTPTSYSISYDLNGGAWSGGTGPVYTYTIESNAITLPAPVRSGYTFTGWTGSNGSTAQTTVTIAKGSTDDKTYTANWQAIPTATPKATATPTATPKATVTPTATPTPTASPKVTATPVPTVVPTETVAGTTFTIAQTASALTNGTEKKCWSFTIGESVSELTKKFADIDYDPEEDMKNQFCIRTEMTPQGYLAYVCQPYGYAGLYFQIYVDNSTGKVVGMATISRYFTLKDKDGNEIVCGSRRDTFGNTLAADTATTLQGRGFTKQSYSYTNTLYAKKGDCHVAAYIDPYGTHNIAQNSVYGIQVFSTQDSGGAVSANDVFQTATIAKSGGYTDAVTEAQGKELAEWAAVFRHIELEDKVTSPARATANETSFAPMAQIHSEAMATAKTLSSATQSGEAAKMIAAGVYSDYATDSMTWQDRFLYGYYYQKYTNDLSNHWYYPAETWASGSPDALGVLTWKLESSSDSAGTDTATTYDKLLKEEYETNAEIGTYYMMGGFAYNSADTTNFTYAALDMFAVD